jgi:hypothetical protein
MWVLEPRGEKHEFDRVRFWIFNKEVWFDGSKRTGGGKLFISVRVSKEEGDCIVCLEMRADDLMRHLISGELTNYRVVRTSPEPLHTLSAMALSK